MIGGVVFVCQFDRATYFLKYICEVYFYVSV